MACGKPVVTSPVGINTVIVPERNKKDLEDIPKYIKKDMHFVFAETMDDVLKVALQKTDKKKPPKAVRSRQTSGKKKRK